MLGGKRANTVLMILHSVAETSYYQIFPRIVNLKKQRRKNHTENMFIGLLFG